MHAIVSFFLGDGLDEPTLERALELEDVVFVGHSVSAMIGVLAAAEELGVHARRPVVYGTEVETAVVKVGQYELLLTVRDLATGDERWLVHPVTRDDQESRASRDTMPGYAFMPDGQSLVVPIDGRIKSVDDLPPVWRFMIKHGHADPDPEMIERIMRIGIIIDEVKPAGQSDIRGREIIVLGPPGVDVADDASPPEAVAAIGRRKCPGLRHPHRA